MGAGVPCGARAWNQQADGGRRVASGLHLSRDMAKRTGWLTLLLAMAAVPLAGQLLPTADGSALFLNTGEAAARLADGKIEELARGDNRDFSIHVASVSAKGEVVVLLETRCLVCPPQGQTLTAIVRQPEREEMRPGQAVVSANGRFLLLFRDGEALRMELPDGEPVQLGAVLGTVGGIASNGTAAFWTPNNSIVVAGESTGEFPVMGGLRRVVLDEAGQAVFYDTQFDEVHRIDLASGEDAVITRGRLSGVSGDGQRLLLLRPEVKPRGVRAYTATLFAAGEETELPLFLSPIVDGVLAGDGVFAFFETASGTLLRVDMRDGSVEGWFVRNVPSRFGCGKSPGAQICIVTNGVDLLPEASVEGQAPYGTELAGWRVVLDEKPVPVISLTADPVGGTLTILAQIPWSTPPGRVRVAVAPPVPAMIAAAEADLVVREPAFLVYGDFFLVRAVHEDGRTAIGPDSPARVGEVVHVFMSGLGAVAGTIGDGEVAPGNPPLAVTTTPQCSYTVRTTGGPLPVLFAGLSPGRVGLYEVSFRVPEIVVTEPYVDLSLKCDGAGGQLRVGR